MKTINMIGENVGKDFCFFVVKTFLSVTNSKIMKKFIAKSGKRKIKSKIKRQIIAN